MSMNMLTVAALFGTVSVGGAEPPPAFIAFNYGEDQGSDWKNFNGYEDCGKPGGSPIDLKRDINAAEYTPYPYDHDNLSTVYENQKNIPVTWNDDYSTTDLTLKTMPNMFSSSYAKDKLGAAATKFDATKINFHYRSEHTVDGAQMDLEMKILHSIDPALDPAAAVTDATIKSASVSILFSVNFATIESTVAEKIVIDNFFESLDWGDKENPTVNMVSLGNLMEIVDFKKRWVYKGSETVPPCSQGVYTNVLRTVYPISKKFIDQFKAQLAAKGNETEQGNFRQIQKGTQLTNQNPTVIIDNIVKDDDPAVNKWVIKDQEMEDIYYNINVNIFDQDLNSEVCQD